jgi:hypothetical protein
MYPVDSPLPVFPVDWPALGVLPLPGATDDADVESRVSSTVNDDTPRIISSLKGSIIMFALPNFTDFVLLNV